MKTIYKKSSQKGFSLIELVISISVILTALLGIAGILGLSIRSNETSRQLIICKTLATTIAETMIIAKESGVIDFANLTTTFAPAATKRAILAAGPDNIYGTMDDAGDLVFSSGPDPTQPVSLQKYDRTSELLLNLTKQGYAYRILLTPVAGSNNALTKMDLEVYPPGTNLPSDRGVYKINMVFGQYRTSLN